MRGPTHLPSPAPTPTRIPTRSAGLLSAPSAPPQPRLPTRADPAAFPTPRAEHYRGVNYQVWRVFLQRYGGGPPICRSVLDIYSKPVSP